MYSMSETNCTLLFYVKCFLSRKDGRDVARGLATPPLIFLDSYLRTYMYVLIHTSCGVCGYDELNCKQPFR